MQCYLGIYSTEAHKTDSDGGKNRYPKSWKTNHYSHPPTSSIGVDVSNTCEKVRKVTLDQGQGRLYFGHGTWTHLIIAKEFNKSEFFGIHLGAKSLEELFRFISAISRYEYKEFIANRLFSENRIAKRQELFSNLRYTKELFFGLLPWLHEVSDGRRI